MRFYKKLSVCLLLLMACFYAYASGSALTVDYAELTLHEDQLSLNASFVTDFDAAMEAAINKGVVLSFLVEFQIVAPRKYWFNDEIATTSKRINIGYHALTRQYLVTKDDHQKSFETLIEALQELTEIRNWKVAKKSQLKPKELYQASLLIRLDKSKLPKVIQVDAISSEDWSLVSPVYSWTIKEFN